MHSTLLGPFSQIITCNHLPDKGPIGDEALEVIEMGGVVVQNGRIIKTGDYKELRKEEITPEETDTPSVLLPGLIDAHTHICFGGSRSRDYSLRISGKTYQEILQQGGGIYDTVEKTRASTDAELLNGMLQRLDRLLADGVTTCEVKSGYGLTVEDELKMLRVIRSADEHHLVTVIPTCLAAHVPSKEFKSAAGYLQHIKDELFPQIKDLSHRMDIFVEPEAFPEQVAERYVSEAKHLGFDITVHADQFTSGGSSLAVKFGAVSADHLEAITEIDIRNLSHSDVTATILPGASLGLGMSFAPARKLLNAGCRLAIASDWNPGSAPMGDLLLQAAVMGAAEKLSNAETFAGLTIRAAKALRLSDRGIIAPGMRADFIAFPVTDFREILYHQGKLKPHAVWVEGKKIS